ARRATTLTRSAGSSARSISTARTWRRGLRCRGRVCAATTSRGLAPRAEKPGGRQRKGQRGPSRRAEAPAAAGREAEAAEILAGVAERNAARPDIMRRVVRRLSSLGADEHALRVADALLEALPGDEEARLAKAAALARRGQRSEALEIAAKARAPRAV